MSRNNGEPYELTARFESRCPETGKLIAKGTKCLYFPKAKKAYHLDSKAAEEYRSRRFAEAWQMGDANW